MNDQAVATKVATTEKNNLVVKHSRLWGAEPGAFMTSMGQNGRRIAGRVIVAIAALCTGERAGAQPTCPSSGGDHVVIDVRFEDPIGGLAIRSAASSASDRLGIIPASGVGVAIGECTPGGWCRVDYQCIAGWALAARYLAPRARRLYRVSGVSAADPDGLNVRTGPHYSYPAKEHIPYDGTDVIVHVCEASPNDGAPWCLATYANVSGWVAAQFVTPIPAAAPPPVSPPPPVTSPPPPPSPISPPASDPLSRACQLYPNLC